ncbi:MAG: HAMP domain-containing protein [bacterium]|nr:HAMP domain-containing protein [bacterium]
MPGFRRLSIGAKLTLRYTAAVSVTLSAVALFVYAQVAQRVNREAKLLIEVQTTELAQDFTSQVVAGDFESATRWMNERARQLARNTDPELALGVELVSDRGKRLVFAGSIDLRTPPVSQAVLDGRRQTLLRAVNIGESRPYLSMAARVPGGAVRVLMNTERYANNVRNIRDVFLWSLPIVLATTAAIGWLLARGSLRPLAEITDTARRISGTRLHESVPESGSGDELDQLAATLNDMLGRIQNTLVEMRRFNANAAHQLRTPLTAMSSQLEVTLEKEREPQEYRRVFQQVLSGVQQLSTGVDAMLRLAHFEAGLDAGSREPTLITEIVETVREFFEPVAEEKGVHLNTIALPAEPILADASWLHQLFSNLVSNAVQYSSSGDLVKIEGHLENDWLVVVVSDTGPGIAPERIEGIFDRFERADSVASSTGFGLGLAIARAIAVAHGGRLEIASVRGEGTSLSVWLPRSAEVGV